MENYRTLCVHRKLVLQRSNIIMNTVGNLGLKKSWHLIFALVLVMKQKAIVPLNVASGVKLGLL